MARTIRRASPRRKMIWARQFLTSSVGVPAAGITLDLLAQFRADNGDAQPLGTTVTRVRFDLTLGLPAAAQAFDNRDGLVCGIIVDQRTNLPAEIPRPLDDRHADWMWFRRLSLVSSGSTTDQDATGPLTTSYELDVASQRKMEEMQETLFFVAQPTNSTSPDRILVHGAFSTLLKLP